MLAPQVAPPDRKPSVATCREHSGSATPFTSRTTPGRRSSGATAQSGPPARHRTRNNGEMSEDRLFDVAVVAGNCRTRDGVSLSPITTRPECGGD